MFYDLFLLALFSFSKPDQIQADRIVINAKIYTVDSAFSVAEAMAIFDGRIMAVGSNDSIMANYWSLTVDDMEGKIIYPGFIDPHCHFLNYGIQNHIPILQIQHHFWK